MRGIDRTQATARLAGHNVGLDGVLAQQDNYRRSGFRPAYSNLRFERAGPLPAAELRGIVSIADVPFAQLHQYDRQVFAADRESFLRTMQTALERCAPLFDQAVVLNAKSLVIPMVLPFALLLPVVFHRDRRPFATHLAFSLHLYALLLLLFCVALAVAAVDVLFGGAGLTSARMDNALTVVNLAACATYLYIAIGRVYRTHRALRLVKAVAPAVAVGCLVLGYSWGGPCHEGARRSGALGVLS